MKRNLFSIFLIAMMLGAGLYMIRIEAVKPDCRGHIGRDGFRRDLFRGVLPPAPGVACQ